MSNRRHVDPSEQAAVTDDAEGHKYVPRDERPPIGEVPKRTIVDHGGDDDAVGHHRS